MAAFATSIVNTSQLARNLDIEPPFDAALTARLESLIDASVSYISKRIGKPLVRESVSIDFFNVEQHSYLGFYDFFYDIRSIDYFAPGQRFGDEPSENLSPPGRAIKDPYSLRVLIQPPEHGWPGGLRAPGSPIRLTYNRAWDIPANDSAIKQSIILLATDMFERRFQTKKNQAVETLLAPFLNYGLPYSELNPGPQDRVRGYGRRMRSISLGRWFNNCVGRRNRNLLADWT